MGLVCRRGPPVVREHGTRVRLGPPPPLRQLHAAAHGPEHARPDGRRPSLRAERALAVDRSRVIRIVEWVVERPLCAAPGCWPSPAPVPFRPWWPLCAPSGAIGNFHPLAAWHSSRPCTYRVSPPTPRGAHFAEEGPSLGLAPKIPPARRIHGAAVAFLSARFPRLKTCDGRVQRARRPAERAPARRTLAAARGPRPRRALRAVCGCANCPFDLLPPVPHTLVAPGDVVVVLRGCGVGPRPSVRKARPEGVPSLHRQPPPWRPSLAGNHTTLL